MSSSLSLRMAKNGIDGSQINLFCGFEVNIRLVGEAGIEPTTLSLEG